MRSTWVWCTNAVPCDLVENLSSRERHMIPTFPLVTAWTLGETKFFSGFSGVFATLNKSRRWLIPRDVTVASLRSFPWQAFGWEIDLRFGVVKDLWCWLSIEDVTSVTSSRAPVKFVDFFAACWVGSVVFVWVVDVVGGVVGVFGRGDGVQEVDVLRA